ncbi:MAG: helix-turn-helix domain-containing protein [Bacteroidota bacterium]
MQEIPIISIKSISQLHEASGFSKPKHPLISIVDLDEIQHSSEEDPYLRFSFDFYSISVKKGLQDKIQYGHQYYDFDEGVMALIKPHQVVKMKASSITNVSGWMLLVHPDFLAGYPLAEKIHDYGFFSYDAHEALHLSDSEEQTILQHLQQIKEEYDKLIDAFSQDVMISQLEVLLNYTHRFYSRQFLTRKKVNHSLITQLDKLLNAYFATNQAIEQGFPSPGMLSQELAVSRSYLNDLLKSVSGKTTQQYIQQAVIEEAKIRLLNGNSSISEIAYALGFQHSQSFSRFFKKHTELTPLGYRNGVG